ncbi:MAG: RdgB/HAM1 family non-canonical purine NTP pyrophosphatase [Methanolinea sp.]|nr:RdgB/HAM1 family non-canonical purine NTP pyrophosphatase [Methanolinea sp.]
MKITVVTNNPHKAREIALFLEGFAEVNSVALECPEIRDESVRKVAEKKAEYAYSILRTPLICDDTGFYIHALQGFPGPYAAYVQRTIGNEGILRLMEGIPDRKAHFETAIAYASEGGIRVFSGRIQGRVVPPRGKGGFGYDPIFEWRGRTLAEMSPQEKNRISHRARALEKLRKFLAAGG